MAGPEGFGVFGFGFWRAWDLVGSGQGETKKRKSLPKSARFQPGEFATIVDEREGQANHIKLRRDIFAPLWNV
jgi:hypothetical protein